MAVYVTSDLHGYPLDRFREHLSSIGFSDSDWLYILGDVIDRNGDGGVAMLRWLLCQPNVQLLRGNHEQMMLECSFAFEKITEDGLSSLSAEKLSAFTNWLANGAEPTLASMKKLLRTSKETVSDILDYLAETPLYETVEAGGRSFLLVHAGLGGFSRDKRLSDYTERELLWTRPIPTDRYFDSVLTVLGHTPCALYRSRGRAFFTDTWVDIDVGCADGAVPMLLRLDDMREFYFSD